ncbi:DinB family protein [Gramella sp. AN32]|uniref:DinB family protein n=1 Tax=Christiangramia antarctica TaxID=2058158 RepID=A0ABW5X1B9_9FLAO|nr:DinB family protein [Gramella sp. AN32]MCM4157762.1 DinB family protein [Gramella sp. AN32]
MGEDHLPEYWLSGKIEEIPDLLQPAAHAILQSKLEAGTYVNNFPNELLWEKPAGRASVGFHLQHMTGVTDRLLTYAKKKRLSDEQLIYLKKEGEPDPTITTENLLKSFENKVEGFIDFLKTLQENDLTTERFIGRKRLPSTLIGVLFHAAEHSQRHIGQMLVTISVLKKEA